MENWLAIIIQSAVGGMITGVAAFIAIRVEVKYLRRDVDELRVRVFNGKGVHTEKGT